MNNSFFNRLLTSIALTIILIIIVFIFEYISQGKQCSKRWLEYDTRLYVSTEEYLVHCQVFVDGTWHNENRIVKIPIPIQ